MTGKRLLLSLFVLALIDFAVPFYLLKETATFTGSYMFWSLLTLIVILLGIYYTRTWRGSE